MFNEGTKLSMKMRIHKITTKKYYFEDFKTYLIRFLEEKRFFEIYPTVVKILRSNRYTFTSHDFGWIDMNILDK